MKRLETYSPTDATRGIEGVVHATAMILRLTDWPTTLTDTKDSGLTRLWLSDDTCLVQGYRGRCGLQALIRPTVYDSFDVAVSLLEVEIDPREHGDWEGRPVSDWLLGAFAKALAERPEVSEVAVADAFAYTLAVRSCEWGRDADSEGSDS